MKIALAFSRPDVDGLLDELTAEQFEEWAAFFALNPHGWDAHRMTTARLSYVIAQVHAQKKLNERLFELKTAAASGKGKNLSSMRAKMEAFAIRSGSVEGAS